MSKSKPTIEELEALGLLEGDDETPFKGRVLDVIESGAEWWLEDSSGLWRRVGPFESEEIWKGFELIHLHVCHGLSVMELAAREACGYTAEYSIHNAMTSASLALRLPEYTRRPVAMERIHESKFIPRQDNGCVHVKTWRNWEPHQPRRGG